MNSYRDRKDDFLKVLPSLKGNAKFVVAIFFHERGRLTQSLKSFLLEVQDFD